MVDFSRSLPEKKKADTTIYTFYELEDEPWLECRRADDSNKPYQNDLLKVQRRTGRGGNSNSIKVLNKQRDSLVGLFAKHIVINWGNIIDGTTEKDVPLTEDDCAAWLRRLIQVRPRSFQEFIDHITSPESYEEDPDGGDAGKN